MSGPTELKPILRTHNTSAPANNAPAQKKPEKHVIWADSIMVKTYSVENSQANSTDKRSICTKFCDYITNLFNKFIACLKNLFCCSNTKPPESSAAGSRTTITQQPQPLTDEQIKTITQEQFLALTQAQIDALTPDQAEGLGLKIKTQHFLKNIRVAIELHPDYREEVEKNAAMSKAKHLKQPALKLLKEINLETQPNDTAPMDEILNHLIDQQKNANDAWKTKAQQQIVLPSMQIVLKHFLQLKEGFLAKGDENADAIRIHELLNECQKISASAPSLSDDRLHHCLQGAKNLIPQKILESIKQIRASRSHPYSEDGTLHALFFCPLDILESIGLQTKTNHSIPAQREEILRDNILPFARQVLKLAQEEANKTPPTKKTIKEVKI